MALGFFRRHQKLVIIIMVVLMVSFLIGSQSLTSLSRSRAEKGMVLGSTSRPADGELTSKNTADARGDLLILRAAPLRMPLELLFDADGKLRDKAPRTWALLLKEARADGIEVSDLEVEALAQQIKNALPGLGDQELDALYTVLAARSGARDVTKKHVTDALANYLLVEKNYIRNIPSLPVPEAQARRFYRDLNEQIQLELVKVPASEYLDQVDPPTEEQKQELFEAHKDQPPGIYTGPEDFGFGYRQPAKVDVHALLIRPDVFQAAVRASSEEIADYIQKNPEQFVEPGEGPDDEPVEMDAEQQQQRAKTRVRGRKARRASEELVAHIRSKLLDADKDKATDAYARVIDQLRIEDVPVLQREINEPIVRQSVSNAIDKLSEAAEVEIVFPVGKHGKVNIDPEVLVDLPAADGGTLEEALTQLAEKLEIGPFTYYRCSTIERAIFPVSDEINLFPVEMVASGLSSPEQLDKHEILGQVVIPVGRGETRPLAARAFSVPEARGQQADENQPDALRVGVEGDPAFALNPYRLVIWRVVRAEPSHSPKTMTEEIEKQVTADWRTKQAFGIAADQLGQRVTSPEGMKNLAEAMELETVETRSFSRLSVVGEERPQIVPTLVFALDLPYSARAQWQIFFDKAFSLRPDDINGTWPRRGKRVVVIPLPAAKSVVLARRIDYRPALEQGFDAGQVRQDLTRTVRIQAIRTWFDAENVARRTGFQGR